MQTYPFGGGSTRLHVGYGTGGICAEVEKEQEGGQGTDTIYYDEITAAKVYSRLPKQKGREWRQYYRLVHNFSKAYPYALVAKKLVHEADSTIAADNLKGAKKTGRKDFTAFRPAH